MSHNTSESGSREVDVEIHDFKRLKNGDEWGLKVQLSRMESIRSLWDIIGFNTECEFRVSLW